MIPTFFKRSCTIHRLRRGPLAGHVDLLAAKLATEGFSRVHSRIQLRLVGHFNRWLEQMHLTAEQLNEDVIERYRLWLKRRKRVRSEDVRTLTRLLDLLRQQGIVPELETKSVPTRRETWIKDYRRYLLDERGLAESSIRNLLMYVNQSITDLNAKLVGAFLDNLEKARANACRSRNLRLTAIRSFFHYTALECPEYSAGIQRVLAIPRKRQSSRLVDFLTRPETEALLAVPDQTTWLGRRDRALLLLAMQTGLRLSELIGLRQGDIYLGRGAHVRCEGKERKQRCTPLTRTTVQALRAWICEQGKDETRILFPSARGGLLSHDSVQYLVTKYAATAAKSCPTLRKKRVTPHVLRHTTAMELLQAGVDRSVIALWLGHESVETTQIYLDANLALKEEALKKTSPVNATIGRFKPDDQLLSFLHNL